MLDMHGIIKGTRQPQARQFDGAYTLLYHARARFVGLWLSSQHHSTAKWAFCVSSEGSMRLSETMQVGKAAEHLVCADLILQGFNAFLADQGLPYDVVLDDVSKIWRIQVKGRLGPMPSSTSDKRAPKKVYDRQNVYRFDLRSARADKTKTIRARARQSDLFDMCAFVALDIKKIAYISMDVLAKGDYITQCIEFRSKDLEYPGRSYPNGATRTGFLRCKFFEDYSEVPVGL